MHKISLPITALGLLLLASPARFPWFAAAISHDQSILDEAAEGDYSNVQYAISFAQRLQAGLYAAFLTDIGLPPVHMSAVIAVL
jgi:hypothetical protein